MSRTSGSLLRAPKLPRFGTTSQQSQLEQPLRARTMGQSPSQEAQTSVNAEPKHLYKSVERIRHKPSNLVEIKKNTRMAARRKEVDGKIDRTSEGDEDEDDESDWSDWNAKVNTTAKRTSTPDHDLGQSTYETTSESEEAESEAQDQIPRSSIDARQTNQASQQPRHIELPWHSPPVSEDHDFQDWKENGVPHSPASRSHSEGVQVAASGDKADCKTSSDDESLAEDLQNDMRLAQAEQKTQRTSAEQHLPVEGNPELAPSDFRYVDQQNESVAPIRTITSDQDTPSPVSIFDAVQDSTLVDNTILQNAGLKLKRGRAGEKVPGLQGQPARKRRKHSIFSPPTSVPTDDEELQREPSPGLKAIQGRFKINRPVAKPKPALDRVRKDQGSVSSWVEPLSHNSSLKHPLFNPSPLKRSLRSRATDQVGQSMKPRAASGSGALHGSTTKYKQSQANLTSDLEDSSHGEAQNIHKPSRTVFTSPKGKSKAKPGVNYSSPPKDRDRATSSSLGKKSGRKRRSAPQDSVTDDDTSDYEAEQRSMEDSESGSEINDLNVGTEESNEYSTFKKLICSTCDRKFTDQNQLRIHKKNNVGQARLYECWKCGDEFDDKTRLLRHQLRAKHQKESFHEKRAGAFSEFEKVKLGKFVVDYCDEHGIDESVFRQMMTDSCRRGRDATWSWPGVTRYEFLNDYYDVLPDRARKSMQRYRERNFQNLEHKKQWTEEDDQLLLDLVDELGPKWIEIGLRLNRTQDSVTQRYKKTLKDRNAAQAGQWSRGEKDALAKVIGDMKDELGLEKTPDTDGNITWSEVSKRMGGIRTAQQCSTHWHRVLKLGPKYKRPSRTTAGRKFKSKELVSSDDENEPMDVKDEPPRAQFVGVVVPKKATGQADHAKPRNSAGSDSHDSESTQQADEDARPGSHVAFRRQISPELGSSDPHERDVAPSLSEADSDDVADHDDRVSDVNEEIERTVEEWERLEALSAGIADRDDRINNVDKEVERTAEEWERLVAAEESQPLLGDAGRDRIIFEDQGNESRHGIGFEQDPDPTQSERAKGPATDFKASRNPLNQMTPGRVMALSQVFEQTQAPTSVPRQHTPIGVAIPAFNSSRPSPNIGLRLHPNIPRKAGSSQKQKFRQGPIMDADRKETNHDFEMEEIGYSSGGSDKDTDMKDVEETMHDRRIPDGKHATSVKDPGLVESEQRGEDIPALPALGVAVNHDENGSLVNRGAETSEDDDTSGEDDAFEDESGTGEEESKSEYESAMTEDSDDGDENEDSNDSMVKGTHDDFMANIRESAKLSKLQSPDRSRKFVEESDNESE